MNAFPHPLRSRHTVCREGSWSEKLHNAETMHFGRYQGVELLVHGNLQPWRRTKVEFFEDTCWGPVGHQVSVPEFPAQNFRLAQLLKKQVSL